MLTVTAENVHEITESVRPLRADKEEPALLPPAREARAIVGSCCSRTSKVFLGAILIPEEDRQKELFACPCCKQVYKDGDVTPVYGTIDEYFTKLIEKHGVIHVMLNSKAAKLGVTAAHL